MLIGDNLLKIQSAKKNLLSDIAYVQQWIDDGMRQIFLRLSEINVSKKLLDAMSYSVFSRGKKVRALLIYLIIKALNKDYQQGLPAACAVELLHTYSLIHDDLPAMDDDGLRRGKPSCHIAYNEATAILAGDALQALTFEVLANSSLLPICTLDANARLKQMIHLSRAAGVAGMAGGQSEDIRLTNQAATLEELESIHKSKTGALIKACAELACIAAGEINSDIFNALSRYASAIGHAFQIKDDILDVTSNSKSLGKCAMSDLIQHKNTYVSLLGIEGATKKASHCIRIALDSIESLEKSSNYPLTALAFYIIEREH